MLCRGPIASSLQLQCGFTTAQAETFWSIHRLLGETRRLSNQAKRVMKWHKLRAFANFDQLSDRGTRIKPYNGCELEEFHDINSPLATFDRGYKGLMSAHLAGNLLLRERGGFPSFH